ncbi:MAG: YggT family protein [Gammaproteobacteria bacterium]
MAALLFLVDLAGRFLVGIFLLRFFMQLTRTNFHNQISSAVVQFTNPLVMPLRKFIPGWGGFDNASLVAAFIVQALVAMVMRVLFSGVGIRGLSVPGVVFGTLGALLMAAISLYTMLIFFRVLLSWFNRDPSNPLAMVIHSLTEPVMRRARGILPPLGGLDLSPILVLIALQALSILVSTEVLTRLPG